MKKLSLIALSLISTMVMAQNDAKNDSTFINLKKTKIIVVSQDENNDALTNATDSLPEEPKKRYKHWAGMEIGINGLLNSANGFDLNNAETVNHPKQLTSFMELDYRHSWQFNLNFAEHFIKIYKHNVGILTGLGFQFNNYELKNNVRLTPEGGKFVNDTTTEYNQFYTFGIADTVRNYSKNRFKAVYITAPLLLEFNTGQEAKKSFHFAIGGLLGYNIHSKMKYVYDQNGNKKKEKDKTDYNLNPFQASALVQIGYGKVQFFATYGFTTLFQNNKGPVVYPVSAGIKLVGF